MEDKIKSDDANDSINTKEAKKPRVSYVSKEHKFIFDFVSVIYKELGRSDYHSREDIAKAHGLSTDTIKTTFAACQQYGLLEIKHGVGYKITDLFQRIYHPINDDQRLHDLVISLKSPEIYAPLFRQYENLPLPPLNGIKNHFVRNNGFDERVAARTAEVFLSNLREYDLLDAKGVLTATATKSQDSEEVSHAPNEEATVNSEANGALIAYPKQELIQDLYTGESNKKVPIFLTKKKVAYLVYPDEITVNDIRLIEHQVSGILLRLQLENEEKQ